MKYEEIKKGLFISKAGSLAYKLSDGSGYGFVQGRQYMYDYSRGWQFYNSLWQQATPEQEEIFIKMLKKECERRGLFEYTKIEAHADGNGGKLNTNNFRLYLDTEEIYNKNGQIFHKGTFAKPLKESTLDQVTDAVKDIADFTIEEIENKLIILTPINK